MNNWKEELRQAFEAPAPLGKQQFLRKFEQPKMGIREFLFSQIGYIRKWIWGVSALIFVVALIGAVVLSADMVWGISALTPLLALTIVTESRRSECYDMAELEMATRYSLKSVTLARLGILGVENSLLLFLLVPVSLWNNLLNPIQAGLYIITPFLLTTFSGMYIVRKWRGREAIYFCTGVAVFIGLSVFFVHDNFPLIYQEKYLVWWIAGALALCVGTIKQYCVIVNRMEELAWNL